MNVSCECVGSFSLPFWGQGVLFPNIIFMSFIGLSGMNLEVKYLECIHNLCNTYFYDSFYFNNSFWSLFGNVTSKMVLLFW